MDVVGNAFNANNPASLPVAQEHLLPLIQDSKKGPAIDLDAFLLAMLEESLQGTALAGCVAKCCCSCSLDVLSCRQYSLQLGMHRAPIMYLYHALMMPQLSEACRRWSKLVGLHVVQVPAGLQLSVIQRIYPESGHACTDCVPASSRLDTCGS